MSACGCDTPSTPGEPEAPDDDGAARFAAQNAMNFITSQLIQEMVKALGRSPAVATAASVFILTRASADAIISSDDGTGGSLGGIASGLAAGIVTYVGVNAAGAVAVGIAADQVVRAGYDAYQAVQNGASAAEAVEIAWENRKDAFSDAFDKVKDAIWDDEQSGNPQPPPADPGSPGDPTSDVPPDCDPSQPWPPSTPTIPRDPLVLDLDGDGIELLSLAESNAKFDFANDGFSEKTGWLNSDDAFLVHDENGNGVVDGISELFGSLTEDGFTALRAFDTNGDGKVDSSDAGFLSLRLWRDLNGDGVSNSGELFDLSDYGIASVSVSSNPSTRIDEGNQIAFEGTYTKNDGSVGQAGAILFTTNPTISTWTAPAGFEVNLDAASLPNLKGYGLLPDLAYSMTLDVGLRASVMAFVSDISALPSNVIHERFVDLLLLWAGVADDPRDSRGSHIDGRVVAFLETYFGSDFEDQTNGLISQGFSETLKASFASIADTLLTRFASQSLSSAFDLGIPLAQLVNSALLPLAGLGYNSDDDRFYGGFDDVVDVAVEHASAAGGSHPDFWAKTLMLLSGLRYEYFDNDLNDFSAYLVEKIEAAGSESAGTVAFVSAYLKMNLHIIGTQIGEQLNGNFEDELIWGGLGDDVINGGGGNDTYVYARGDGNDTITEGAWSGTGDELILTDINPSDVTVSFSGSDLLITIAESAPGAGDAGSILIKATLGTATEQGVETIVFANGTTWNKEQIRAQAIASVQTAGNDTIVGFGSGDTYAGGLGDDVINGGGGNDTYVYARGDGNDTITESEWSGTSDKLILTDINPADVTVSFAGSDLLISIAESAPGAGDAGSILIKATLGTATEQGVETIVFANGTTWNKEQIRAQAIASVQTAGNDTIVGFGSGDTYAGGLGDDVINGGGGNDTYVYARGDGNDTIIDGDWSGTADQLTFTNINPDDITLIRDGDDIRVLIRQSIPGANDNGSIVIKNTIEGYSERGIEKFVFSDGTIWDRSIILAALTDPPIAQPTPTITGTSGDDVLVGTAGNDVFKGDTGDDQLNGGAGSDIYIYASGDGNDNINDDSGITTDKDTLLLVDMNPDDITLTRVGLSSILTVKNSGQTITLNDQFYSSSGRGVEQIEFANGTVWDRAMIAANSWIRGTFGNDQLGTDSNPYRISNVTVDLGLGDDSVNADWATGYTVIYRSGDGNDTYRIWNNTQSTSVLKLLDLNVEDLTFSREGQHLKITDVTTGQTITTRYFFDSNEHAFARIDFADGTQWGRTQILEQAAWIRGTPGNDQLGTDSNPYRLSNVTVDLGLGDDSVNADWATGYTVIYRSGDGNDTYRIWNNTQSTSVLKLLDLNVEDLTFSREGQHLKIADVTTGQTITTRYFFDSNQHAFARIDFADGTQWGRSQILEKITSIGATSENDIVVASNSPGEIDGSRDDIITDKYDRDTFVFTEDFGQDLITDFVAAAGTDNLPQGDDGLFATFEDVLAAAAQTGNDTVISFDAANTITLQNVVKTDLHHDDVRFVA